MALPYQDLRTERLVLNKMLKTDIQSVFELRSNKEYLKFIAKEPMKDLEEAKVWLEKAHTDFEEDKGINWAIRQSEDGPLVGMIGFWRLIPQHHRAEIGYSLDPRLHRQGLVTEACKVVFDFGFDVMKLHSIQAEIDPLNEGSRKILEKHNFRKEAHFTEDYFFRGEFSDSAIYSLLEKWYRPK